jgi:hypothetical protein
MLATGARASAATTTGGARTGARTSTGTRSRAASTTSARACTRSSIRPRTCATAECEATVYARDGEHKSAIAPWRSKGKSSIPAEWNLDGSRIRRDYATVAYHNRATPFGIGSSKRRQNKHCDRS